MLIDLVFSNLHLYFNLNKMFLVSVLNFILIFGDTLTSNLKYSFRGEIILYTYL
jgi:hypothetical protein